MTTKRTDRLRIIKPPMHIFNLIFHPFTEGSINFLHILYKKFEYFIIL